MGNDHNGSKYKGGEKFPRVKHPANTHEQTEACARVCVCVCACMCVRVCVYLMASWYGMLVGEIGKEGKT